MRHATDILDVVSTTFLVPAITHGRVLADEADPRGPLRLLVGFHGYAQGADEMLARLQSIVAPGWVRVSVQALNRMYRGRSHETVANWMTRQDRDLQIADNVAYVDAVVERVAGGRDLAALVYCGFSQGVSMAFRAALLGRRPADAVLALGGDVPPELLVDSAARCPRVLLAAGARDRVYAPAKRRADVEALTARGVDVREVTFDGGHEWHDAFRASAADLLGGI